MTEHERIPQQHCTMARLLCLSEADFQECLVQFFRPFESTRPMNWSCIQESVTFFASFFRFQEFVDLYFNYIFSLFEDFRIIDRAIIQSTLSKFCRFKLNHCGFQVFEPYAFWYPSDVQQFERVPWYEYNVEPRCVEELLSRPFLYRDPTALMQILRYIVPVNIEKRDFPYYCEHVADFMRRDPFLAHVDLELYWNETVDQAVSYRRFKLTLMVLDFVLQVRIKNYQDAIKGLRLLFQSISDPYVTWVEIFGFLTRWLKFSRSATHLPFIKSFQESCRGCFPECLRELKPRSLKHLARCKVRTCMDLARTLPHGVWSLGLPREMEDYVLLQTRRDQFRPVIRALSSERVFQVLVVGPLLEIQSQETLGLGISVSLDSISSIVRRIALPPSSLNIS